MSRARGVVALFLKILVSFCVFQTAVFARPLPDDVHQRLHNLFLAPIPQHFGIERITELLMGPESPERAKVLALLVGDPELLTFAQEGREFHDHYLAMLREDFSDAAVLGLVTDPETTVLRALETFAQRDLNHQAFRPFDEAQLRNLAWSKAMASAGFPPSTTFDQLQSYSRRMNNLDADRAQRAYQNYLFRLQELTVPTQTRSRVEVQKFKNEMIASLLRARIQNFKSLLVRRGHRTGEYIRVGKGSYDYEMDPEALASWRFEFVRSAEKRAPDQLTLVHKAAWWNVTHPIVKVLRSFILELTKDRDTQLARGFYEISPAQPTLYLWEVRISSPDGDKLTMSEGDFVKLLHALSEPDSEGLQGPNRLMRRYLAEATPRDQMLAELIFMMDDSEDADAQELHLRLERRHQLVSKTLQQIQQTTSSQMRRWSVRHQDLGTDLVWAGFAQHPDYWSARDQLANQLDRFYVFSDSVAPQPSGWQQRKARISAQNRLRTNGQRFLWRGLNVVGYAALLLTAEFIGLDHYIPRWINSHNYDLASQRSLDDASKKSAQAIERDESPLQKFLKLPMFATGSSDYDMNEPMDAVVDPHPDDSQAIFRIEKTSLSNDQLPMYFNLISNFNLSEGAQDPRGAQIIDEWVAKGTPVVLTIRSVLHFRSRAGRLPVLALPGFVLEDIEMIDDHNRVVPKSDYKIFKMHETNLTYAQFLKPSWSSSSYSYVVHYGLQTDKPAAMPSLENLDPHVLRNEDQLLRASGFTHFAEVLDHEIAKAKPLSMSNVTAILQANAFYTHERPGPIDDRAPEAFRLSTQFAHQGDAYYQCSGSAQFLNQYGNEYFHSIHDNKIVFQEVRGYVHRNPSMTIMSPGHVHVIAFERGRADAFREYDSVPGVERKIPTDDLASKNPGPGVPAKAPPILGILPTRPNHFENSEAIEGLGTEDEEERALVRHQDGRQSPEPSWLQLQVQHLKDLTGELIGHLEMESRKSSPLRRAVGIQFLPNSQLTMTTPLIDDYVSGSLAFPELFRKLVAISMNMSPHRKTTALENEVIARRASQWLERSGEQPELALQFVLQDLVHQTQRYIALVKGTDPRDCPPALLPFRRSDIQSLITEIGTLLTSVHWQPDGCRQALLPGAFTKE
jgi:hypothetical protein